MMNQYRLAIKLSSIAMFLAKLHGMNDIFVLQQESLTHFLTRPLHVFVVKMHDYSKFFIHQKSLVKIFVY